MYLLPSGFTLIRIIILLLIRFSYFTITKPQTSGFGTNLKFKAKKNINPCSHIGPYEVVDIKSNGLAQLKDFEGNLLPTRINGYKLKIYHD
jgi:hypothetical protein